MGSIHWKSLNRQYDQRSIPSDYQGNLPGSWFIIYKVQGQGRCVSGLWCSMKHQSRLPCRQGYFSPSALLFTMGLHWSELLRFFSSLHPSLFRRYAHLALFEFLKPSRWAENKVTTASAPLGDAMGNRMMSWKTQHLWISSSLLSTSLWTLFQWLVKSSPHGCCPDSISINWKTCQEWFLKAVQLFYTPPPFYAYYNGARIWSCFLTFRTWWHDWIVISALMFH